MLFSGFYSNAQKNSINVKFGIYVKSFDIDCKSSSFKCDFYWWLIYPNDVDTTIFVKDEISKMEFINCEDCTPTQLQDDKQEERSLEETNEVYITGHTKKTFRFETDFKNYPFDKQVLPIILEHSILPDENLKLISDDASHIKSKQAQNMWGLGSDIVQQNRNGFRPDSAKYIKSQYVYSTDFGDPKFQNSTKYSRINYSVFVSRNYLPYLLKVLIPLIVILILAYLVFYLPADRIEVSSALAVTSLLSAVAFQISVSDNLPSVGYLTSLDKVFYFSYFLIAVAMLQTMYTFYLDRSTEKRKLLAYRLDMIFKYAFPLIFIMGVYFIKSNLL